MKKLFTLALTLPIIGFADNVATTASLSVLQNQITQFQQQIQTDAQSIQTANQNLADVSKQLSALKTQINQYGAANLSQFKWVDVANNQTPAQAYVAATNNGTPVYVCQAAYSNGSGYYGNSNTVIDPGVVTPKGCVITYGGQAYLVPQYSVLTSNVPGYWINGDYIKSNNTQPPILPMPLVRMNKGEAGSVTTNATNNNEPTPLYNALAIIGGQENGNNIYICRVEINNQYFLGKVANNTCYVAAGKYEATWPVYEVLLTRQP